MVEEGSLTGQTLRRYRFEERVGEGASSEVYRAHDLHLRRDVAVKVISESFLSSPGRMKQILREARIHARLEHVNIVRVYDLLRIEGKLLLVLRLLRGLSLKSIAEQRCGPMEPREAYGYARQFLRGTAYAHSMGIVHLDLKPQNIQITPAGEALIMDFGVARMMEDRNRLTGGKVAGSPAYMAPEQAQGLYTDARADIYSLGVTLYELLAGRHPFVNARSVKEVLNWQIERMPPPLSDVVPDVPPEMERAVMMALAKKPARRFKSCRDFALALRAARRWSQAGTSPERIAAKPADERVTKPIEKPIEKPVEKPVERPTPEPDLAPPPIDAAAASREESVEDRRWDPRSHVPLPVRIVAAGGMAFVNGEAINISASGMAVRMPYRATRGASVQVEIDLPPALNAPPITALADVVWVRTLDDGDDYQVGLRFSRIADEDRRLLADVVRDHLVLGPEDVAE